MTLCVGGLRGVWDGPHRHAHRDVSALLPNDPQDSPQPRYKGERRSWLAPRPPPRMGAIRFRENRAILPLKSTRGPKDALYRDSPGRSGRDRDVPGPPRGALASAVAASVSRTAREASCYRSVKGSRISLLSIINVENVREWPAGTRSGPSSRRAAAFPACTSGHSATQPEPEERSGPPQCRRSLPSSAPGATQAGRRRRKERNDRPLGCTAISLF